MPLPRKAREYVLYALEGTPDVLDGFLQDLAPDDPLWDARPDPQRFTLREIVAHLADWEPISLGRIRRILSESEPTLPDIDEGQLVIENDYAHSDPHAGLTRFREGRVTLIALLRSVEEADWQKRAYRDTIGPITLEAQAVLIAGHDGYHTRQVAQWLRAGKG